MQTEIRFKDLLHNFDISVEGTAAVFLYIDSTQGWKLVDQSKAA